MKRHVINWLQAVGYPPRPGEMLPVGGMQGAGELEDSKPRRRTGLKKRLWRLGMPAREMITRRSHRRRRRLGSCLK